MKAERKVHRKACSKAAWTVLQTAVRTAAYLVSTWVDTTAQHLVEWRGSHLGVSRVVPKADSWARRWAVSMAGYSEDMWAVLMAD